MDDDIQNRCMAKLTDHVLEKIVRDNRTTLVNHDPDQPRRIAEQRINKMMTDFHTPVHPTYAFMIHRAITELKTEGGSDKESISKFIQLEYDDLPLAHESVLKFQLNKLCEKGEIVLSELGCYMLPAGIGIVLEKQVLKQSDELKAEKKGGRGGGSRVESNKFNENGADVELQKVNVTSEESKKQNGKAGVRPGCRWSRTLKFSKPPEEERNEHINKHVEVLAQTGGDANGDQRYHTESSIADHQFKDEVFAVFDEPLEPPGFPSKKDQLIKLKQQAQADLQAFGIVVEAKQKQAVNDEELQLQAPAREFAHDVSRPNHVHPELPDLINAGVDDQGKPETEHSHTILKLSTVMELSPMLDEDTFDQSVIKPIAPMVQEDQPLSAEVDTMPAKPRPEAYSKGIIICLPSYNQHPEKHQIPLHRGRGRPHKMTPNGGLMVTEKPKKKQGRGRPRKQKPGDLPESKANVEVETIARKATAQWDWEVVSTPAVEENSDSGNDEELQLQAPAREFAHDVSRPNHVNRELPDLTNAGVAVGALLSSDQGKPETEHSDTILKLSTVMELSPMLDKDTFDQSVIKPIAPMVQEDQPLSAEVDAMPAKPGPEACSKGIVSCLPSYNQHPEKHQIPVHRGRGRPHKMTPNGGLMVTEKPKKKQGRGRPRKQKPGDLPESEANVEVETIARKASAQWDWEVVSTPTVEENSDSGNDTTLASESASQDKETMTTNKRKRIGRPPKIDRDEHRESLDSPKVKRGRGKGCNSISYTDISITDLVYSQDHHLQPMSRIRGRPRKL